jgi:ribosome biogenesis GTPase A
VRGGEVQWHKAAEMLLTDFRQGQLGRITLETPEEMADWRRQAAELEAAAQAAADAARAAEKLKRSGRRQGNAQVDAQTDARADVPGEEDA